MLTVADADLSITGSQVTGLETDLIVSFEEAKLNGGDGDNTLDASSFTGRAILWGAGENDVLITTTNLDSKLNGGAGDDTLYGSHDNDTLYRGKGNDRINGGPGSDTVAGGPGADTLIDSIEEIDEAFTFVDDWVDQA